MMLALLMVILLFILFVFALVRAIQTPDKWTVFGATVAGACTLVGTLLILLHQ
jgi:hypothetical protein